MFKNILLATDGSAASEQAAARAAELARAGGSRLAAVFVVDPYPYLGIGDTNPTGIQAYLSAANEHAAQAHARVREICGPDVQVEARVVEHATARDGILQTAKEIGADLIVLGTHGRGGFTRFVLGSVASKVLSHSPVAVLVVPHAEQA